MIKRIAIGAGLGLAWGSALRAWMVVLALNFGETPSFSWSGTFAAILLPAALVGGLIGCATYEAETSVRRRWRWVLLSPLLLALTPLIVVKGAITVLMTSGLGSGAFIVAAIGMLGGYALSGVGNRWLRWLAGVLSALIAIGAGFGFFFGGGVNVGSSGSGELFGALYFVLLMGLLAVGISVPARYEAKRIVAVL